MMTMPFAWTSISDEPLRAFGDYNFNPSVFFPAFFCFVGGNRCSASQSFEKNAVFCNIISLYIRRNRANPGVG
jgi:hypothetical protein